MHEWKLYGIDQAPPDEAAAQVLSKFWGDGGFPVDPVLIARSMGLDVIVDDLAPNISGGLVKESDFDPVIVLAERDHPNRQRFTCAHEIGHYVVRTSGGRASAEKYNYSDSRGVLATGGTDNVEIYANQFAAALLMPEDEVRHLLAVVRPGDGSRV